MVEVNFVNTSCRRTSEKNLIWSISSSELDINISGVWRALLGVFSTTESWRFNKTFEFLLMRHLFVFQIELSYKKN